MTVDPEALNAPGDPGRQGTVRNRWLIAAFVVVALILVGIIAYAMLSTAGFFAEPEPTNPAVFITITEPTQGARLDTTWQVEIRGQGGGLFEGNVVVQALDAAGNILVQEPTTIQSLKAGMGGAGPPLKTDQGWLLIYYGVDEDLTYRLGIALLDLDDPAVVLKQQEQPILEPEEEWELALRGCAQRRL